MKRLFQTITLCAFVSVLFSCSNEQSGTNAGNDSIANQEAIPSKPSVKEEQVSYTAKNTTLKSYVAYDENQQGKRPVVLIVPEWWGLTDYPRKRAEMLANLGYLAMAVDMYGDGKIANNPSEAQSAATPFYTNPQLGKERLDAALAKAKTLPQADASKAVVIGYCFGGSMALNYAKLGAPVLGAVSFHGGLEGVPPQKGTKAAFLICHGAADSFVPEAQVAAFKKSMDSAGVAYTFKAYDGATHAFTNPDATKKGAEFKMPIRYNGAADTASWNDMKEFFGKILK